VAATTKARSPIEETTYNHARQLDCYMPPM